MELKMKFIFTMKVRKRSAIIGLVAALILGLVQCRKEEVPPQQTFEEQARDQFYLLMKDWYLWYNEMPDIGVEDYATASELLEAVRFKPKDKWSYITTVEEFLAYYQKGTYAGHGFGYSYTDDGKAFITFVFRDSDLYGLGVTRGWQIMMINGQNIQSFTNLSGYMNGTTAGTVDNFQFRKPDGSLVNISSTRKDIVMNTVLYADTLHVKTDIIGHVVLKSFIEPTINELDSVFNIFKSYGVNKLILDLRYNGGGKMDVATKLASLIAGSSNAGKVFVEYQHNDKKISYNQDILLEDESNAPGISEVIIFTSRGTASASETVINGLIPHMDVVLIGDRTYGKPVGMYSWSYADYYVFVPVSFSTVNSNGVGDYYDGLTPDSYMTDGLQWEFSDRNEIYLKEAIYYLNTNSFTGTAIPKSFEVLMPERRGLKFEIGAE